MPEEELTVKIKADANELVDKLDKSSKSVKEFGDQIKTSSEESAKEFTKASEDMSKAEEKTEERSQNTTKAMVEQGREIRKAGREYALANIEQIQYNQMLSTVGNTAVQWGSKMQGSNQIVSKTLNDVWINADKASGGLTSIVGAMMDILGKSINFLSQMDRMRIMFERDAAEAAVSAGARRDVARATEEQAVAQETLNVSMGSKSFTSAAGIIGGIAMAVTLAAVAYEAYNRHVEDAKKKNEELIKTIREAINVMKEQFGGEVGEVGELKDEYASNVKQIEDLNDKRMIALSQGKDDLAEGYYAQSLEISRRNEILQAQIESKMAKGPAEPDKITEAYTKIASEVGKAYYKKLEDEFGRAHRGLEPWGEKKTELQDKARDYGQAVADAYVQGIRDGFYSDENRAILEDAEKKLGITLKAESPPKEGPLQDIDKWGQTLAETYADGIERGSSSIARAGETLSRSAADRMSSGQTNNTTNQSYNIAPSINIQGGFNLRDPSIASEIARVVSLEIKRLQAVS